MWNWLYKLCKFLETIAYALIDNLQWIYDDYLYQYHIEFAELITVFWVLTACYMMPYVLMPLIVFYEGHMLLFCSPDGPYIPNDCYIELEYRICTYVEFHFQYERLHELPKLILHLFQTEIWALSWTEIWQACNSWDKLIYIREFIRNVIYSIYAKPYCWHYYIIQCWITKYITANQFVQLWISSVYFCHFHILIYKIIRAIYYYFVPYKITKHTKCTRLFFWSLYIIWQGGFFFIFIILPLLFYLWTLI